MFQYIRRVDVTEEYTFIFLFIICQLTKEYNIYLSVMKICSLVITNERVCVSYSVWDKGQDF
jgi:hypothetical protein